MSPVSCFYQFCQTLAAAFVDFAAIPLSIPMAQLFNWTPQMIEAVSRGPGLAAATMKQSLNSELGVN